MNSREATSFSLCVVAKLYLFYGIIEHLRIVNQLKLVTVIDARD